WDSWERKMAEETVTEIDSESVIPVDVIERTAPADTPDRLSSREAGRILAQLRHAKPPEQPQEPAAPDTPAPPAVELPAHAADTAAAHAPPGETEDVTEPAVEEPPPIEPPRSWTKGEKERFQSLPRETQEYLAEREQERDRTIRQSQNEAAEKLKGLTAREQ